MSETNLFIQAAPPDSPDSLRLIGALNRELTSLYPEEGAVHSRLTADEVAAGRGAFLLAWSLGEAVACGAVRLMDPQDAELKRMYVEPSQRRRGIGRRLLQALEDEARSLGALRLVLETGERQPAAIALYRWAGFRDIEAYDEYVDSPLSYCMAKQLD